MNCAEITGLLPEYIRRRLPADQMATVRAHLSDCTACAAAYEDELAFGAMVHGTDLPAPTYLMAQVMAGVRAEPRQAPAFRVGPLDFVLAIGVGVAFAGLFLGLLGLRAISPLFTNLFDLRALLADGLTVQTLTLGALCAVVVLAICIPIAAMIQTAIARSRDASLWWNRL